MHSTCRVLCINSCGIIEKNDCTGSPYKTTAISYTSTSTPASSYWSTPYNTTS